MIPLAIVLRRSIGTQAARITTGYSLVTRTNQRGLARVAGRIRNNMRPASQIEQQTIEDMKRHYDWMLKEKDRVIVGKDQVIAGKDETIAWIREISTEVSHYGLSLIGGD